jgi:hypothetical protein
MWLGTRGSGSAWLAHRSDCPAARPPASNGEPHPEDRVGRHRGQHPGDVPVATDSARNLIGKEQG